jgi:hypothetical protein
MSEYKRFKSNTEIHLANTLGRSVVIGKDFAPVHQSFWGEAYAAGAIPEDVKTNDLKEFVREQRELKKEEEKESLTELREKLLWIYENPNDFLNPSGSLNIRKVVAKVQMPVKADVILSLWDKIVKDNS